MDEIEDLIKKLDDLEEAVFQGGARHESLSSLTQLVDRHERFLEDLNQRVSKLEAKNHESDNHMKILLLLAFITSISGSILKNWEYIKSLLGM